MKHRLNISYDSDLPNDKADPQQVSKIRHLSTLGNERQSLGNLGTIATSCPENEIDCGASQLLEFSI